MLSFFRKDLMVLADVKFREEYAVEKNNLGPKYKIFVQKQRNASAWTEIDSIENFLRSVNKHMATKGRMKNGILQIEFSFGRMKSGQEFQIERDMHNYMCKYFGEGIQFS